MASPKYEVFFLFDAASNAPATGATPTFLTYKDDTGANLAQPAIVEIGGGAYRFLPVFSNPDRAIVYIIDPGANKNPSRVMRFMRPEDWADDTILADTTLLRKIETNRWRIATTGADANKLIIYDDDGTTVLRKFALKDPVGDPTFTNPFERAPTA